VGAVEGSLAALGSQLLSLKKQILDFDRMIMAWHRSNQTSKRPNCIPGVGPLLATALVASVADPKVFRSGRNFSAWIGLVPKQHSSGGRARLGSISKQGDRYLRGLFVVGALAVIRYAKLHGTKYRPWVAALLARRPDQSRCHRPCQQARPNGLGNDGQGRAIQLSSRTEGLTRSRRVPWRDVKVGRANST
jgi:transposase